ncbi:hypothetical protein PHLGIDRAFT_182398 [Phlebiopsis gigantea 11061_1 CR5-6]|uniref:B30.2/SPRY domain-containing protein n=1 Tax=Phlebiopsis gigantea (strain 11061_1 CR5-6) TaxID=745531 RepID=A0A0C3S7G1_PHLG1|nr:hypothetical protein PHLGIDRAFT_182398 [Phlebiopsis gigantea 11061_1 CR5-6]
MTRFLFDSPTASLEGSSVTYSNQGHYDVSSHPQDLSDCFEPGDIVGCGYDHQEHKAFFTRNGIFLDFLPIKSATLCTSMRPCVCLEGFSGSVRANFGAQPFLFDINYFVDEQQTKRMALVDALEHAMWPREQELANSACVLSPQQGALPTPPPSPRLPRRRSAAPEGPTSQHVLSSDAHLHPYAEGSAACAAFCCAQEPRCCPSPPPQQQTPPASPPHRSRSPLHALRLRVFVYWDQKTERNLTTSQDRSALNPQPARSNTDPVPLQSLLPKALDTFSRRDSGPVQT